MTCPFLSRLPSQFVKNYSSKLLKTYGEHCPVVSHVSKKIDRKITAKITTLNDDFDKDSYLIMQGASQTLASPGPLSRDPALCQEGAAQVNISIKQFLRTRVELYHVFNFFIQ